MEITCITVGSFSENAYFVVEGKDAIAIDPGDQSRQLIDWLEKRDVSLGAIICTHAHLDHVGAVQAMSKKTGAPFLIHKDDAPMLASVPSQALLFGLTGRPAPKPDRLLEDQEELRFGSLNFQVLHTPGHTPGGICLLSGGVLFSGDTLFAGSVGRTDLPGGSHSQLILSIHDRLMTLEDSVLVYPGHGPSTTIGAEKSGNPFL
ncbi:MAG TPA: MBL fold metallo-hydrolase [Chroococcales cyanobacterium]